MKYTDAVSITEARRRADLSLQRAQDARHAAEHRRRRRRVDLVIGLVLVAAAVAALVLATSAHAAPRRVCLLTGRCYTVHHHHHRHRQACPTWRDYPVAHWPAGCPTIYPPPIRPTPAADEGNQP
jgi:hypothetical protein